MEQAYFHHYQYFYQWKLFFYYNKSFNSPYFSEGMFPFGSNRSRNSSENPFTPYGSLAPRLLAESSTSSFEMARTEKKIIKH